MNVQVAASRAGAGGNGSAHLRHLRAAGQPAREYYAFIPSGAEVQAPLVLIHGISRNAAELAARFAALAEQCSLPLIAPLFRKTDYGMYQQVVDPRHRARADDALCDILEDASQQCGLEPDRFHLFGFSGGGQFAHRFALLHPRRLLSCIPVSAGWYSWPDEQLPWPLGLAHAPSGPIDRAALAALPMHVVVGSRDTHADEALRRRPELDALQGTDRVERARRWHRAMHDSGFSPECTLTLLDGARHSFDSAHRRGLVPLVFSLLGFSVNQ